MRILNVYIISSNLISSFSLFSPIYYPEQTAKEVLQMQEKGQSAKQQPKIIDAGYFGKYREFRWSFNANKTLKIRPVKRGAKLDRYAGAKIEFPWDKYKRFIGFVFVPKEDARKYTQQLLTSLGRPAGAIFCTELKNRVKYRRRGAKA